MTGSRWRCTCQPRLVNDKHILTAAGREFDNINQAICDKLMDVMERLRDGKARNVHERTERAVALLCYDLGCDSDVSDVAITAVESTCRTSFDATLLTLTLLERYP